MFGKKFLNNFGKKIVIRQNGIFSNPFGYFSLIKLHWNFRKEKNFYNSTIMSNAFWKLVKI